MAMKQTQTKLFNWSDTGLDFCSASSNLLFDRFKRMYALGYNEQTVLSATVNGNEIILTYGGVHGYVVDRVLKVNAPEFLSINGGEFVIDSVTENTVTITVDDAPLSIAGGFKTNIAPLGWDIVYETPVVQVYRFKALDESDLYLRLFMSVASTGLVIHPCVGASYDPNTGFITDPYADSLTKEIVAYNSSADCIKWAHLNTASTSYANYTYTQGYSAGFGRGMTVGSKYHLANLFSNSTSSNNGTGMICAVLPAYFADYPQLKLPVVFGTANQGPTASQSTFRMRSGNIDLTTMYSEGSSSDRFTTMSKGSFLPTSIDTFNTTMAAPFYFKTQDLYQVIGLSAGGAYHCCYSASNMPPRTRNETPWISSDIDFNSKVIVHYVGATAAMFVAFPIEEIKYGI